MSGRTWKVPSAYDVRNAEAVKTRGKIGAERAGFAERYISLAHVAKHVA